MLTNYLKIAWRNLRREKGFATINIVGLAVGMAATMLLLQYVSVERSYDQFHRNADRIVRVTSQRHEHGIMASQWAGGPFASGNHLKAAFPEVADYVKLYGLPRRVLAVQRREFRVEKGMYATPSFFNVFSFPLVEGNPQTALTEPMTGVLSVSLAKRLFGSANPVGQLVRLERETPIRITGIFADFPKNSHLQADYLLSLSTFETLNNPKKEPDKSLDNAWTWDGCLTYLLLKPGADRQALASKLPAFTVGQNQRDPKTGDGLSLHLQPLTDIHLYSHLLYEAGPNGDGNAVYVLLCVALFIIGIAWINYVNLATARAISRAKEVGVRKAVGSHRSQLIGQFMIESALLNLIAVGGAFALITAALPLFNQFTDQQLTYDFVTSGRFWLGLGVMYAIGTVLSGLYPAFVLSGFKPVAVLKSGLAGFREGIALRKSLVVVQFSASVFLLVATITVFRQLQFMRSQNLGVAIDQTMVLSRPVDDSTRAGRMKAFKTYLRTESGVRQLTVSSTVPGEKVEFVAGGLRLFGRPNEEGKQYRIINTDYDFINTYGLKLVAGRNFDSALGEKDAVIFNRTALRQLGFTDPAKAIGQQIDFWDEKLTIVGVIDNFHQQSPREAYDPLILRLNPTIAGPISIKLAGSESTRMVGVIRQAWQRFFPTDPFEFSFLDEQYDRQYRADDRFGQLFGFFTLLAVLVSCLGLLGLVTFTAQQRKKEIGVRKVLGASVTSIVALLSRDFLKLVFIAIVVASPIAWYAMHQWLQDFAYRIDISWWIFALAGLLAVGIALLTVSFQSIKAALVNPVKSLRSE
ncbi:ABC transporter permease [uncultured Spirosoma sp.]|uniref:ABC transporter permease n=1 Tax=uncultured Spirosoma sp. TaxID=278208 RepID=UPI0025910008|nr:ABC transporter permease [uncultured Spirosoma sp.]